MTEDIEDDGFITLYPDIRKEVQKLKLINQGIVVDGIPSHGSPQDRGSADAYYGREYNPHWWPEGTYEGAPITQDDMTENQIAQYRYGYETETEKKE